LIDALWVIPGSAKLKTGRLQRKVRPPATKSRGLIAQLPGLLLTP
jgi:hypothetical protein